MPPYNLYTFVKPLLQIFLQKHIKKYGDISAPIS
nr:MAG TPA: hypothetical protein [Caudoviricetes sp.]